MDVIDIFKKKKRVYFAVLMSSLIFFLLYFSFWYEKDFGISLLILGTIALALFINIYRFSNWRCPNCNAFLGSSLNVDHCHNCNCGFSEDNNYGFERPYLRQKSIQSEKTVLATQIKVPRIIRSQEKYEVYN